jgi:DNA-binding CsgD family transcriptional regulator
LEQRLRRIASEIEAAGVVGHDRAATDLQGFPGLEDLTERQREILARLLRGDRVPTISRGMHLATSTVRNHLTTVYRKVGVHSQAELIERLHSPNGS